MGWTLPEVRDMDVDDFNALCDWAKRRAEKDEDDSVDVDELLAARKQAQTSGDD